MLYHWDSDNCMMEALSRLNGCMSCSNGYWLTHLSTDHPHLALQQSSWWHRWREASQNSRTQTLARNRSAPERYRQLLQRMCERMNTMTDGQKHGLKRHAPLNYLTIVDRTLQYPVNKLWVLWLYRFFTCATLEDKSEKRERYNGLLRQTRTFSPPAWDPELGEKSSILGRLSLW